MSEKTARKARKSSVATADRPGGERHQPNDLGDPILNSDRDVTVTPIRHTKGQLDDSASPIPPPPEPNDSDYDRDPTSKHSN